MNTRDVETGYEGLPDPGALGTWLGERSLAPDRPLHRDDLAFAVRLREALRALLLANNGRTLDPSTLGDLRQSAERGLLRIAIDDRGGANLSPARGGVDALAARVLAAVAEAQAEGVWERLKACPADDCQVAFYDNSRNRSRVWCSMDVCGNRAKTRSYRARRSSEGA